MNDLEKLSKQLDSAFKSMKKTAWQTKNPRLILRYYFFFCKIKIKALWIKLRF